MAYRHLILAAGALLITSTSAQAAKKEPPQLASCEQSIGSIAVVDGDTAGWNEWGLGSPRAMINALAVESGCFTLHDSTSGEPAQFLVSAIAGSQEEVDQGIELAKTGASEALLRSGAAGSLVSRVPLGGSLLGAFGGLGGKKKTVAAGLRVVSPANGQTLAAGSGSVRKSSLSFRGSSNAWAQGAASASGYASNKDGRMLTEAFIIAFNQLVAQREILEAAPQNAAAQSAAQAAVVAVDTNMLAAATADAETVRTLRAGTELTPTGNREGLFIEVSDNYGTTGWVSVEDMQ